MIPLLRKHECGVADTDCFQSVVRKSGTERSHGVKTGEANKVEVGIETLTEKSKPDY